MCSFKSIYFVIFVLNLYKTNAQISDKRLCGDPDCKEPLSLAKTLIRYSSSGPGILSFAPNEYVTVYSKEAGSLLDLWGVEIKGRRGYVPKKFVREYKVIKKPEHLVDTDRKSQVPIDKNVGKVEPSLVQEPFDVIDGTTFYLGSQDDISPSSTECPVLSTAVPPGSEEVKDETETLKSDESTKEKDVTTKEAKEESVVDNVISTLSNWMNDDPTSEESEEAEDDEDDEDDFEDLDESIDIEEEPQKDYILQQPEDIDSLHNLPSGVSVSSYSLQTEPKESIAKIENPPSEPTVKVDTNPSKEDANTVKNEAKTPETNTKIESQSVQAQPQPALNSSSFDSPPSVDVKAEIPASKKEEKVPETNPIPDFKPMPQLGLDATTSSLLSPPSVAGTKSPVDDKLEIATAKVPKTNTIPDFKPMPQLGLDPSSLLSPPSVAGTKSPVDDKLQTQTPSEQQVGLDSSSFLPQKDPVDHKEQQVEADLTAEVSKELPVNLEKAEPSGMKIEAGDQKGLDDDVAVEAVTENAFVDEDHLPMLEETTPNPLPMKIETDNEDISEAPIGTQTVDSSPNQTDKDQETNGGFSLPPVLDSFINSPDVDNKNEQPKEDLSNEEPQGKSEDGINEVPTLGDDDLTNNMESKEVPSSEEDPQNASEDIKGLEKNEDINVGVDEIVEESKEVGGGFLSSILSLFGGGNDEPESTLEENVWAPQSKESVIDYCDVNIEKCNTSEEKNFADQKGLLEDIELSFNSDIFIYLLTTSISVIIFLFGYMILDRSRREAPLVSRINKLEKELLVTLKEIELLQEKGTGFIVQENDEAVEHLSQRLAEMQLANNTLEAKVTELEKEMEAKGALEEQIESLEKELETSTEVGMELNRIISEMLDPTDGSERLKENVEQLQRQLLEQKATIDTISIRLQEKEAENRTVQLEWEESEKRGTELRRRLEEMAEKVVQVEKEREQQQGTLQNEITIYRQKFGEAVGKADVLNGEIQILRVQLAEVQRQADIKSKEYTTLQESLEKLKSLRNDRDALKSLLDVTSIKAELQQLRSDNEKYVEQLQHEQSLKAIYEKKYQTMAEEVNLLRERYEQADREKVEANSRLEVLNNYFKKREAELQEEVIKYKSIWETKEGEATSTTERIKYIQEEIENYKAQNETLKQEIISQEIDLKSQISMLEKKVHENWVTARQTERKLEDAKQEAAQLRNRLTLRERTQNRLQSPVDQNGELTLSPHPIDSPASPPLLYSGRDHITKSPPIPGLPPFLPPPPGAPFMPPPLHGMPPFMPPPPSMYPGDHRPPPLGRMSSPPLNSRYSPDSSAFSPYDRNSPSPQYDSEYGASPPPLRGYSPYSRDDRRDYKRPPHVRTNGRNVKGSTISSGSEHSNDSLDKINRKQSKMV